MAWNRVYVLRAENGLAHPTFLGDDLIGAWRFC